MRYFTLLSILITGLCFGQISFEKRPVSFSNANFDYTSIPTIEKEAINVVELMLEDQNSTFLGLRSGIKKEINLSILNAGLWYEQEDGSRIWLLKLKGPNAKAVSVYLENLHLPKGGFLSVYSPDRLLVRGAFDARSFKQGGVFTHDDLPGEELILEVYEPESSRGETYFDLASLCYMYILPEHFLKAAGSCNVDVACAEGQSWQDIIKSVVRIKTAKDSWVGWCSGTLINNVNNDCRPLILTAWHCGLGNTSSDPTITDMDAYIFYFNYELSNCGSGTAPNNSVLGCAMLGNSQDGGGDAGSDFMLVELNAPVPWEYNVFYAGWDATGNGSNSGVSIHHPSGDFKKISTYSNPLVSDAYGTATDSHWKVNWVATPNGHGVTEGGSSGGALFNSFGRLLGQLTGGGASCSNLNSPDLYGKMSYNWNSNIGVGGDALQTYLDPNNLGNLDIAGTYAPCLNSIGENREMNGLKIYPNPSNEFAQIESVNFDSYVLDIFALDGKLIKSIQVEKMPIYRLNLSEFSKGLYILNFKFEKSILAKKLIVE